MSFIDSSFPMSVAQGSTGGPSWNTQIVVPRSGIETRNQVWSTPRYEFDAAFGLREMYQLTEMIAFFHRTRGKTHTFRFKDWSDYSVEDEVLTNPGSGTTVQLTKTYFDFVRIILLPVAGTVDVYVDDVLDTGATVDTDTGIITLSSSLSGSEVLTWTGEFDVHCRFDTDTLNTNWEDYTVGSVSIPVIEVKV